MFVFVLMVCACRWSATTCSIYLKCIKLASRAFETEWILTVLLPGIYRADWSNLVQCPERGEAVFEVRTWLSRPSLRGHVPRLLQLLSPGCAIQEPGQYAPPSLVEQLRNTRCAFTLANWVMEETKERHSSGAAGCDPDENLGGAVPDLPGGAVPDPVRGGAVPDLSGPSGRSLVGAVSAIAKEARLPESSASLTPSQFISACKKRRVQGPVLEEYLEASALMIGLHSKWKSSKPMASALRAWGGFCDLTHTPHFPVRPERVVQFAAICRDAGTFRCYLSHVKSICEFMGMCTAWAEDPLVRRAKQGLKKLALVYKPPPLAIGAGLLIRLASADQPWVGHRACVVLAWVFMLRASSEAIDLVRAADGVDVRDCSAPLAGGVKGLIGLVNGELVIRLASRKNSISGEVLRRGCVCARPSRVSVHVPAVVCPVHVIWPWVAACCNPGDRLFPVGFGGPVLWWLRMALEARGVAHSDRFGLHSLRRGAARELVDRGGDLATLLRAGGWKSSAFRSYLDMVGLENTVCQAGLEALFEGEDDLE